MKVAVTGATGFIGKKLTSLLLKRGDEVRILTRRDPVRIPFAKSVRIFSGDLCSNKTDLRSFADGVDVLYHCAGEVSDLTRMAAVHVEGTQRLLDAASGRIGRWVQLSSVGAYGRRSDGVVTEKTPEAPQSSYETTKTESDRLVIEASRHGGIQFSILRPSNVFGVGMTSGSLRQLIKMIQRGLFFFIGPPGASANYIHVQNVVYALILCGTLPQAKGRTYNLSDHRSLEHFVEIVAEALGKSPPRRRAPENLCRFVSHLLRFVPGMPLSMSRIDALVNRCIYANNLIEKELSYSHQISMEEGLRECVSV